MTVDPHESIDVDIHDLLAEQRRDIRRLDLLGIALAAAIVAMLIWMFGCKPGEHPIGCDKSVAAWNEMG